jgi:predicted phosphodiesterase
VLVVCEPRATWDGIKEAGQVHLFDLDGNQVMTLQSSNPREYVEFGEMMATSEDIFVVNDKEIAHVFNANGDRLTILQVPESQEADYFLDWMAIHEDIILISEENDDITVGGEVFLFDVDGNLLMTLNSPEPQTDANFGGSLAVSEDLIVVGEPEFESEGEGRVYVFDWDGNLLATLRASEPTEGAMFGGKVSIVGDMIIVSDSSTVSGERNAGGVYLFREGTVSCARTDTPVQDDTFCFIAYGDTRADSPGNVSSLHEEIVCLYLEHDPELILHTGDLVYHGGEWYQYADFNDSIQLIWDYEVPFFTAAGNHEMYTDDWVNDPAFTNYTAYVDYSDVAAACGGTELYYSFNVNGTLFMFLNTEHDWDNDEYNCSAGQLAWLESELEATEEDDFVVLVFHRPPYSVRYDRPDRWAEAAGIREEFHSLFVAHDVDLVFNGHDHLYYRTVRDGIYYIVTGGGGAPLALYQTEGTVWQEGDVAFSDYHYCVAKYESGYLNVEVLLRNGTVRDSFSLLLDPGPTAGANVKIYVKDDDDPIVGASVTSTSQPSGQTKLTGSTGVDGSALFSDVEPGSYVFLVSSDTYVSGSCSLDASAGRTTEKTILLEKEQQLGIPTYIYVFAVIGGLAFLFLVHSKIKGS